MTSRLRRFCAASAALALCLTGASAERVVVNSKRARFGDATAPEWEWFQNDPPQAASAEFRFDAKPNPTEATLFIRQADVKFEWRVVLNGRAIGKLSPMPDDLVHTLAIPSRLLREKDNTLSVLPLPEAPDDIVLNEIVIDYQPGPTAVAQGGLKVDVTDENGTPLPARITVTDGNGTMVPLIAHRGEKLAVRPGVAYTGSGRASLGLLPGQYRVHASRGFEYSVAAQTVEVKRDELAELRMQIRREVETPGLVSADTHIHTLTHSGHGDSTLDERMLTIAGEGVELPVATEHNKHADYAEAAKRMGVAQYFTPVRGNEVTTSRGHFNIFPVDAGAPVPDSKITAWPDLLRAMRDVPGVRVVQLNHPRSIHNNFRPFAPENFNTSTGENPAGLDLSFDVIEALNSGAQQSDYMLVFRDWFSLLNRGHRIVIAGASDSHDVSRFIVGQARTYIAAKDTEPGRIDVAAACGNLRVGRATVCMGLLPQIVVAEKYTVGDLATNLPNAIRIQVKVHGPSWVKAERVELYANGERLREGVIPAGFSGIGGEKIEFDWTLPRPEKDTHLVVIATGPAVTEPFWAMTRPYQPNTPKWTGRSIGVTNPVWLDADGDGKFTAIKEQTGAGSAQ